MPRDDVAPRPDFELSDAVTLVTALGNRIDIYWQRYLYMNAAFAVVFGSSALSLPFYARLLLLLAFLFILARTFAAMKATYKGIDNVIEDIKGSSCDFGLFKKTAAWMTGFDYKGRVRDILLMFFASAAGISILAIGPFMPAP